MRSSAVLSVTAVGVLLAAGCGSGSGDGGGSCDPLTNASCISNPPTCRYAVGASEAPAPELRQHVASARVGTTVTFDVPVNTASVTIVEQAVTAPSFITYRSSSSAAPQDIDNLAVPFWVKDPAGNVIYDDNQDFGRMTASQLEQLKAYGAGVGPGVGTLTVPGTTGGLALLGSTGLPAGTWSLQVSDLAWECTLPQGGTASCTGGSQASTYDVTVITKAAASGGTVPSSGALDVTFYLATRSDNLSATSANAGTDGDVNRMVQSLTGLLGKAGIAVRSTTFVDLPSSVQARYATGVDISGTDACSDLAELLKNGKGGLTLNVFLVSAFTGADLVAGKSVVGLDGTIPGPATIGGNAVSGVAVSTVDLRGGRSACSGALSLGCGADLTAYYIAHETGHYLGLYHTTEMNGYRFDPLSGTPTCVCSTCKTSTDTCATSGADATAVSHTMSVDECTSTSRPSCGGGDNLMFWTLGSSSKGNLTADQKSVMLASPLVQ